MSKIDYDLLIENSAKSEFMSNIKNLLKDVNLDETNVSGNITPYRALLTRVIKRLQAESDLEAFCSVIVPTTPSGLIPVYVEKLTGKTENGISDDIKILKMASELSAVVGDTITASGGAEGEILYIEPLDDTSKDVYSYILVKVTSGTFAAGETVESIDILEIFSNIHAAGYMLPGYSGEYTTAEGEQIEDSEEIDFELILKQIDVSTKDLKTGITLEAMQDLIAIYGLTKNNTIDDSLTTCIKDKSRQRIFKYMRENATVRSDMVLTDSYGVAGGIADVWGDVWARAQQSIGKIGTNTGIRGASYSIIGSSNVISGLKTYLKGFIETKNGIDYAPGKIPLIEDGYTSYDYMIVTMNGRSNNSAIIYSPYDLIIISAKDPVDFSEKIMVKSRSTVINNPLFDNADFTKNPMMEFTFIDTSNLVNYI